MKRKFLPGKWSHRYSYMGALLGTLTKRLEKKLDGNYTRMLRAILNKSWRQHPLQDANCTATCLLSWKLFKLDEPDMQDTAGEAGTNSSVMYSLWTPTHGRAKAGRPSTKHTFSSYVRIQDVVLKTCLGVMNDREEWRERVRDIRATSTTWWWWWFTFLIIQNLILYKSMDFFYLILF